MDYLSSRTFYKDFFCFWFTGRLLKYCRFISRSVNDSESLFYDDGYVFCLCFYNFVYFLFFQFCEFRLIFYSLASNVTLALNRN